MIKLYQKMDLLNHEKIGDPDVLPQIVDGLSDHDLSDLTFLPDVLLLENIGFWPLIENDPVFNPATETLDGSKLTYTTDNPGRRILVARKKRKMTDDELLAYERAVNPVPSAISDRQFAQALAMAGIITEDEAREWVKVGNMPAQLEAIVNAIPDEATKFSAQMLLEGATVFERNHPMTEMLGSAIGMNPRQIDDIWRVGVQL